METFFYRIFTIYLDYVGSSVVHRLYLIVCFPSFKVTHTNLFFLSIYLFQFTSTKHYSWFNTLQSSGDYRINACIPTNARKPKFTYFLLIIEARYDDGSFSIVFFTNKKAPGHFTCIEIWIQKWWCMQWCAFAMVLFHFGWKSILLLQKRSVFWLVEWKLNRKPL